MSALWLAKAGGGVVGAHPQAVLHSHLAAPAASPLCSCHRRGGATNLGHRWQVPARSLAPVPHHTGLTCFVLEGRDSKCT